MKIQAISNINFKGFYSKKNEKYSDSQNRCIDNIKAELGDLINSKNFQVEAGDFDTVELYHIEGLHEGVGVEDSYYRHASKIGTFDEKHPFKKEDLKKWEKEETAKVLTLGLPLVAGLLFALIFGIKGCCDKSKEALLHNSAAKEFVLTVKDSTSLAKELSESFMK